MKRIGFIGLGTMGMPMAQNLLKAGYELAVYNRRIEKAERLRAYAPDNLTVAASPKEVAGQCEVVFTMLTADSAVEEVLLGKDGIVEGARKGLIVVDSSTISPNTSKRLAHALEEQGIEWLDAPVTGSEPQAMEGTLTFMVGGKPEVFEQISPLFERMGKHAFYMGPSGSGSYTKLANNTMAAINLLSLSEAIVMAAKSGIDPELFVQVVSGGGARSGMADNKAPKIIKRDFHPNFSTALMHKDLTLASQLANELRIPTPALSLVREMLQMAITKGYGQEDVCSVVKCYEEWAGVEVTRK